MEIWFIILLAAIAVIAITLLLFLALLGDDTIRMHNIRHRRGEYINDQTAVIYQTIMDTTDSEKAYLLFIEYVFTNLRQFLRFVPNCLTSVSEAYYANDIATMTKGLKDIADMRVELKDQKITQDECIKQIDPKYVIESAAWIHLSTDLRFAIVDGIKRIIDVTLDYGRNYSEPIPKKYAEQLQFMVEDICNICKTSRDLIGTGDIEAMRELRKRTDIIKSESYDTAQRLYELLHDGRSEIDDDRRLALSYVLNAQQECHCIIYALRRLALCSLCLTLSLKDGYVSPRSDATASASIRPL